MERKTRIWLGLGTAVLVGGASVDRPALASLATDAASSPERDRTTAMPAAGTERMIVAQAEGGEGGPNEGGGQVLGTITEFRLSSTDPGAFAFDASQQVEAYASLVHDSYAEAHARAEALQTAAGKLLEEPSDATLDAAREALLKAHAAYLRTEAFLFYAGPVDGPGGPLPRLNIWPIDPGVIDYTAENPDGGIVNDPSVSLNFRHLAQLNQADGPQQVTTGFHAIEFLLWGESGSRPASDFVAGEGNDDRRRDYLTAVTRLLVNDLGILVAAWASDANNYRASVEAMDQRNAIGRAFNGMAVLVGYEIPLRRIGAGLFPANENFQSSPFSDASAADIRNSFEGAERVYFESGFDRLLVDVAPGIAADVAAAFERAETALAELDAPYSRFLAPPAGSAERTTAEKAVRALTDLGHQLRRAGNRLGVLVVIPGL
jgi:putative iron-regulated protein